LLLLSSGFFCFGFLVVATALAFVVFVRVALVGISFAFLGLKSGFWWPELQIFQRHPFNAQFICNYRLFNLIINMSI
jgi:hypothetical protein